MQQQKKRRDWPEDPRSQSGCHGSAFAMALSLLTFRAYQSNLDAVPQTKEFDVDNKGACASKMPFPLRRRDDSLSIGVIRHENDAVHARIANRAKMHGLSHLCGVRGDPFRELEVDIRVTRKCGCFLCLWRCRRWRSRLHRLLHIHDTLGLSRERKTDEQGTAQPMDLAHEPHSCELRKSTTALPKDLHPLPDIVIGSFETGATFFRGGRRRAC